MLNAAAAATAAAPPTQMLARLLALLLGVACGIGIDQVLGRVHRALRPDDYQTNRRYIALLGALQVFLNLGVLAVFRAQRRVGAEMLTLGLYLPQVVLLDKLYTSSFASETPW
jgi:hypothetical protein